MILARKNYIAKCRKSFEEFMAYNPSTIIRYIKRGGKKKGVVIVTKQPNDEEPYIGWSLCRKGDKFNKYIGLTLAIKRAFKDYQVEEGKDWNEIIPMTVWGELSKMTEDIEKKFHLSPVPDVEKEEVESTY